MDVPRRRRRDRRRPGRLQGGGDRRRHRQDRRASSEVNASYLVVDTGAVDLRQEGDAAGRHWSTTSTTTAHGLPSTGPRTRSRPLRSSTTTAHSDPGYRRRSAATTTGRTGTPASRRATDRLSAVTAVVGRSAGPRGLAPAGSAAVDVHRPDPACRTAAWTPLPLRHGSNAAASRSSHVQLPRRRRLLRPRRPHRALGPALPLGLAAPPRRGRPGGVRRARHPHGASTCAARTRWSATAGSPAYDGLAYHHIHPEHDGVGRRTPHAEARAWTATWPTGTPTSPRPAPPGSAEALRADRRPGQRAGGGALRRRQGPHRRRVRADPVAARRRRRRHRRRLRAEHRGVGAASRAWLRDDTARGGRAAGRRSWPHRAEAMRLFLADCARGTARSRGTPRRRRASTAPTSIAALRDHLLPTARAGALEDPVHPAVRVGGPAPLDVHKGLTQRRGRPRPVPPSPIGELAVRRSGPCRSA